MTPGIGYFALLGKSKGIWGSRAEEGGDTRRTQGWDELKRVLKTQRWKTRSVPNLSGI